jgi:hypothetical protein
LDFSVSFSTGFGAGFGLFAMDRMESRIVLSNSLVFFWESVDEELGWFGSTTGRVSKIEPVLF